MATIGWLVVLAGLAAFVGSIGSAPSSSPDASGSIALGSAPPTAAASVSAGPLEGTPLPAASPAEPTVTLVGAGDIASCGLDSDAATAALVERIPGTVFTAGDNAYESGTADEFATCFEPTWGASKARIRPAAGNHDWNTPDAAGYLEYFGDAAVNAEGQTWYSYNLGAWHIIVLDSDCAKVGGCEPDSEQGSWLAADLAASDARCSLAIWHHPLFSSGVHGGITTSVPLWEAVASAGVDVVLNGHDHDYERFAPQDEAGAAAADGTREFVVGTGGAALRPFPGGNVPNSLVRSAIVHGVIELTLQPSGYVWRFHSTDDTFSDQGSAACH
jgi:calcineurin-like phosphoesterase family protein